MCLFKCENKMKLIVVSLLMPTLNILINAYSQHFSFFSWVYQIMSQLSICCTIIILPKLKTNTHSSSEKKMIANNTISGNINKFQSVRYLWQPQIRFTACDLSKLGVSYVEMVFGTLYNSLYMPLMYSKIKWVQ